MFVSTLIFTFSFINSLQAGKILFYSPTFSPSHILFNGKLVDLLVKEGHDVVMVIPEYVDIPINGTKLGKVIRMKNVGKAYNEGIDTMGGDMFDHGYDSVKERIKFERILNAACEGLFASLFVYPGGVLEVMKQQDQLLALKKYHFDLAITEMVDFCGVGIMRYLGIKSHIWISTTPIHDTVVQSLGKGFRVHF